MAKVLGCCKSESTKQIETWIAEFEQEAERKAKGKATDEKKAENDKEEEGHPT